MLDLKITAEAIAEALRYPIPGWPFACAAEHGQCDAWASLKAECRLDPELATQDDVAVAFAKVFITRVASDLGELMVSGDTDSEDRFLATLNGLQKMTTWPDELLISKDITIEHDTNLRHVYKLDPNGERLKDADGLIFNTGEREMVDIYVVTIHVAWNWEAEAETAIAS